MWLVFLLTCSNWNSYLSLPSIIGMNMEPWVVRSYAFPFGGFFMCLWLTTYLNCLCSIGHTLVSLLLVLQRAHTGVHWPCNPYGLHVHPPATLRPHPVGGQFLNFSSFKTGFSAHFLPWENQDCTKLQNTTERWHFFWLIHLNLYWHTVEIQGCIPWTVQYPDLCFPFQHYFWLKEEQCIGTGWLVVIAWPTWCISIVSCSSMLTVIILFTPTNLFVRLNMLWSCAWLGK